MELLPHLFRTEYRKIVAVLVRRYGFDLLEVAEDLASETFLAAAQTWPLHGLPENPVAWLYRVAQNKASNEQVRGIHFQQKVAPILQSGHLPEDPAGIDLSPQNIKDSQLRMLFAICHPALPAEAQIGLALRILCGFGIEEIAAAFLTSKETINKRLYRAKEKLRNEKVDLALPETSQLDERLASLLMTIYLLFNEGYYSTSSDQPLRRDLCLEAMRLCAMLTENSFTNLPPVNALLALMCFHASRFDARTDEKGELVLYHEQDQDRWNEDLVRQGTYYFHRAAQGRQLTRYHLEAGIAYWYTRKEESSEKWENILQLYNRLLQLHYSPVAALNRTYALSKANGRQEAIREAEKLNLYTNPFYFTLLGELYTGLNDEKAIQLFRQALGLAITPADKSIIQRKLDNLNVL